MVNYCTIDLACTQKYEDSLLELEPKRQMLEPVKKASTKNNAFALPKTEQEVAQTKLSAVPAMTLADTGYCIGI